MRLVLVILLLLLAGHASSSGQMLRRLASTGSVESDEDASSDGNMTTGFSNFTGNVTALNDTLVCEECVCDEGEDFIRLQVNVPVNVHTKSSAQSAQSNVIRTQQTPEACGDGVWDIGNEFCDPSVRGGPIGPMMMGTWIPCDDCTGADTICCTSQCTGALCLNYLTQ